VLLQAGSFSTTTSSTSRFRGVPGTGTSGSARRASPTLPVAG